VAVAIYAFQTDELCGKVTWIVGRGRRYLKADGRYRTYLRDRRYNWLWVHEGTDEDPDLYKRLPDGWWVKVW
jgi:hypothetical protein